jgi:hypothetical protein
MTSEQFIYWLQGFMEISDPASLNEEQTQIIKDHLKLVLNKQTPERFVLPAQPWVSPIQPLPYSPPICDTPNPNQLFCSSINTPSLKP